MSGINLLNDGDTGLQARTIINSLVNAINNGTTGTSGSSGANGAAGTSGTSGASGSNGTSGTSGVGTSGTSGVAGISGVDGVDGSHGTSGTSGIGIPTGGTSGQILSKIDGTNYNTEWIDAPSGGGGASFPYTGTAGITGLLAVTGRTVSGLNAVATGEYSHAEGTEYINPISDSINLSDTVFFDLYNDAYDGFISMYNNIISISPSSIVVSGDFSNASTGTIVPFTAENITLYDVDSNTILQVVSDNSMIINGNTYTSTYSQPVVSSIVYDSGLDRSTITFSTPMQSVYAAPNTQYPAPQATGYGSHAEGVDTVASGSNSHAEGVHTTSGGIGSHTEGIGTIASGNYQHVQGKWNVPQVEEGAFIIGNGADEANRSNLFSASDSTISVGAGATLSITAGATLSAGKAFMTGTSGILMPSGVKIGAAAGAKNNNPYNVAIGEFAFASGTSGEGNVAIGVGAMSQSTSGNHNIALGRFALQNVVSSNNIAIGDYTLATSNDGTSGSNIAMGGGAGQIAKGGLNTYIGSLSGNRNSSGNGNTGVGHYTVGADTNGQSGSALYTGSNNTALGKGALRSNASGNNNIAVGVDALVNSRTMSNNIGIGNNTMYNTYNNHSDTIAIGNNIFYSAQFGQYNIVIGHEAAKLDSGGSSISQAYNSMYIGYDTRATNNATNEIVIGHTTIGNGSNTVTLGNTSITRTQLRGQVVYTPQSSAPASPVEGAIYYNSVSKKHFGYNGTAWTALY